VARMAVRKWAVVTFSTLILAGLGLSASRWGHRGRLSQNRTASPRVHSIDLKWNASTSRVVGYNVYRSEQSGGPYTKLTQTAVPMTGYTDRTVQGGHTYFYLVTAVDGEHESLFSNLAPAIVPLP
jgi:hypothetical protein